MQLQSVEKTDGEKPGRVRVHGRVRYDGDGHEEVIWFDLPRSEEAHLSSSGNPWLVALLPIAVSLREPLRIPRPVDPLLLEGCHRLLEVWCAWYPHLAPIPIEATAAEPSAGPPANGTGLFFSGGVDSFHSLIRRNDSADSNHSVRVSDLLLVHGADIPISDSDAFGRLRPRMAEVAHEFGAGLVDIATNIRDTRWGRANWPDLSHAALLTSAGLLLESRLSRLLIASSASFDRLRPYGSHPITDPLYSTSRTRVIHDSADRDRPDKIRAIAAHPAVHRHLRVCWLGRSDSNCGRCPKCFHTMVGLELAGMLGRCETLPRAIEPSVFRNVYFESQGTYSAYGMLRRYRQLAWLAGRHDLVRLLDHVLQRSDRLGFTRDVIQGLARRGLMPAELGKNLIARLFRSSVKY